jgi:hypothetical protein
MPTPYRAGAAGGPALWISPPRQRPAPAKVAVQIQDQEDQFHARHYDDGRCSVPGG